MLLLWCRCSRFPRVIKTKISYSDTVVFRCFFTVECPINWHRSIALKTSPRQPWCVL
jgi:hypothetical protein